MKRIKLEDVSADQLVDRFAEIGIAQYQALLGGATREFSQLYGQMDAIDKELRARGKEARLALVRLYDHPNIQVRLQAASFTLGTIFYGAGYQITNESVVIPTTPPYSVPAQAPYGEWASDGGVVHSNGVLLTAVTGTPGIGQYAVVSGVYSFAPADAGSAVLLTYGYVPADLASCCMDWAAERYAYRSRIGQHSKSLGGQETMAFIVKDIPDFVVSALSPYRRVVMP
jgi:Domain of unknown function (DUF2019)